MDSLSISMVLLDVIEAWKEEANMWHVISVLAHWILGGEPFLFAIYDIK